MLPTGPVDDLLTLLRAKRFADADESLVQLKDSESTLAEVSGRGLDERLELLTFAAGRPKAGMSLTIRLWAGLRKAAYEEDSLPTFLETLDPLWADPCEEVGWWTNEEAEAASRWLDSKDQHERCAVCEILPIWTGSGHRYPAFTQQRLREQLHASSPRLTALAYWALMVGDVEIENAEGFLSHPDPAVRAAAFFHALERAQNAELVDAGLTDPHPWVRLAARWAKG